ncbi:MAG: pseudouridine synthase [Mycobacteriales bacterium]
MTSLIEHDPTGVRLQKVLAGAGVASRRICEEMIAAGRVRVNGDVVSQLGVRVNPVNVVVHVDGVRVILDETLSYYALHKPPGVVTAMSDDRGRRTIAEFVSDLPERVYHVGRLDVDTEGLLLLTNDGDLAHRLTHPSFEVFKTYLAQVGGDVSPRTVKTALHGVELDDGPVDVHDFRVLDRLEDRCLVELVIHEGRKRIVRRFMDALGHPVLRLVRTRVGPVQLEGLAMGERRKLTSTEAGLLYQAVDL